LIKVEIRPATTDDYQQIVKLIKTKEDLFLVYPKGSFPFTLEQLCALASSRLDFTVVAQNNRIIGFANLYNFKPEESVFIGNVIIDSSFRGKGLGKNLVLYMLELIKQKYQLPEIKISVFNSNTAALLLYSQLGFMPYQIEERFSKEKKKTALIHMKFKL